MGARGPKTPELSIIIKGNAPERPAPPEGLSQEQSKEWMRVVNRLPPDWFPGETHSMLSQYCRHYSASKMLAVLVAEMQDRPVAIGDSESEEGSVFSLDEYDKLLKMQERESRAMTALARSLRFTLQASYDKEKGKKSKISGCIS